MRTTPIAMSSRRRRRRCDSPPYSIALSEITHLEHKLIAHTIKPKFTTMDVVRMLITDEQIEFLQRALDMVQLGWSRGYAGTHEVPFSPSGAGIDVDFRIRCVGLAVWKEEWSHFRPNAPRVPEFTETIRQLMNIHQQWDKVRKVVSYFNDNNASAGAVRYYWPSMSVLLPPGHMIHSMRGSASFRELNKSPAPFLELFRETAGIVGAAKFLPPDVECKIAVRLGFPDIDTVFGVL